MHPQEQKPQKMNWIIISEPYKESSNGVSILHKLADKINTTLGQSAYIAFYNWHADASQQSIYISDNTSLLSPKLTTQSLPQANANSEFIKDCIVIYPEAFLGNPLGATRIVRYYGNKPGFVTPGHRFTPQSNEFSLCHSKIFLDNPNAILFNAHIDECFYTSDADEPIRQRTLDLVYQGKGALYGKTAEIKNALLIHRHWPAGREQLSMLLKKCRFFYTYDSWSNIVIEAIAAGAIPIFLNHYPFTQEEIDSSELGPIPKGELIAITENRAHASVTLEKFLRERKSLLSKVEGFNSTWNCRLEKTIQQMLAYFKPES